MPISIRLNGQSRELSSLSPTVLELVDEIGFRPDRVAIEVNGLIVSRALWGETTLATGDNVELVHFVGGGTSERLFRRVSQRSP